MIAKNSTLYPYLAIAKHYNISYAEVLAYSDTITERDRWKPPYREWKLEIWTMELAKLK